MEAARDGPSWILGSKSRGFPYGSGRLSLPWNSLAGSGGEGLGLQNRGPGPGLPGPYLEVVGMTLLGRERHEGRPPGSQGW